MIYVGPGTGCAPFRSMIHQIHALRNQGMYVCMMKDTQVIVCHMLTIVSLTHRTDPSATTLNPVVFFFGCRSKAKDYLYEEELQQLKGAGTLLDVFPAFSRDQEHKIYVQHLMRQQAKLVWDILGVRGGYFYLSGYAAGVVQLLCSSPIVHM